MPARISSTGWPGRGNDRYRVLGGRQGAVVEFAVDRQRQRLDHHHRRRHHIGRQPLGQRGAHPGRVCGPGHIAHQPLIPGTVLAGDHHRLLHPVQPGQRRLTSPQLDAIPADLDLLIGAPQIPQLPISAPPHQIPAAIHPCPRRPRAPNGHATNRDPVKAARRTYPHPTPAPATYNSPTTPAGTGRNHPSSTNNATPATGDPIGTTPDPGVNGALMDAYTVVSVGPYVLIITRPGAHRSTSSAGQGSPPTTNATDPKPSGDSTATADGVWLNTLTCSATSKACKSSGEPATDSGTTTSRPPCNSAPQISHTEKSKAKECHCAHTCRRQLGIQ